MDDLLASTSSARPPADDPVARLDAQLHQAQMRRRFGTGSAPVIYRQWRIDRRLGRGGMGAVYLAFDQALDRPVALKIVPRPRAPDHELQWSRVRREAQAIAAIKHPNVVHIHQVHLDGDSPVIEMEHIDGPTLRAWQAERARPWRVLVAAYASAGDGVAAIHRAGLVHRDIKPENLLIPADGVVRVVDLGLAWSSIPRDDPPARDALAGTVGYIAPEVFAGAEPSPLADQFSFCVALYEALLGVRPFRGDTPAELARAMVTGTLTRPASAARLPRWLLTAVTRGLRCDPGARHTDMEALVEALRRGLARRKIWTRGAIITLAIAGLVALGATLRPAVPDPCAAADEPTAIAPERLAALHARIGPEPTPARRSLEVLTRTLDARARAWAGVRGQLCRASRRPGADGPQLLEQWRCHDRRRTLLQAVLDDVADAWRDLPARLLDATTAIEQLPDCDDPAALARLPSSEQPGDAWLVERLTAAQRHENAGNYPEAERLVRDVVAAGDSRRRPEALYRLGHILGAQDRCGAALEILDDAYNAANGQGNDRLACQISAYRAKLLAGSELAVAEGGRDIARAESCVQRTGLATPLLRAEMLEARGLLAATAGRPDEAVAHHEEALYLRRTHLGEQHIDVTKSLHNLGNALAERGQPSAALRRLESALALRRHLLGRDHPRLADVLHDLGHLYDDLNDPAAARRAFEQASAILRAAGDQRVPFLADIEMSLADLDLSEGDLDTAAGRLRRARQLQAIDRDLGPSHPQRALLLHLEARLHETRGDFASALSALTEATRLLRAHDPDSDEVLRSAVNEVRARYALEDFAGIVDLARDAGPRLITHLRERPPKERGLIAWYIGDSQLHQQAPAATIFLALALTAYRDQGASAEVMQLQRELALAQDLRTPKP